MTLILSILIALAWVIPAAAGSITFSFELQGDQCVVVNRGDNAAYYPAIFQLARNGQWRKLETSPLPAELTPGERVSLQVGTADSAPGILDPDYTQALLIRFFDQAGVSFGQVALFRPPPESRYEMKGGYAHGRLKLSAPSAESGIRATWLLAPFEEGIRPVSGAFPFTHTQPPATRIKWQGKQSAAVDIGAATSAAMLLHETADGLTLQTIHITRAKTIEQRTTWLYKRRAFYLAGGLCALCYMLLCTNKPKQAV
jgi:hypothetical protein